MSKLTRACSYVGERPFDSDVTIQNHEIMKLLYRWIKKTGATGGMQGEYR